MFGFFAKVATEYSNHFIDWSRVAELIYENNHHYTREQLIVRGAIIGITAVSAFLGAYMNDEEQSNHSSLTIGLAAGTLGFALSHTVIAVLPLMKKRLQIRQECENIINDIELKIKTTETLQPYHDAIHNVVKTIMAISLSDEHHARASQTWGRRKHLLQQLSFVLEDNQLHNVLSQKDANEIVQTLNVINIEQHQHETVKIQPNRI